MTWPSDVVAQAYQLRLEGTAKADIARRLEVSRGAVQDWFRGDIEATIRSRQGRAADCGGAGSCPLVDSVPSENYSYLLGQYLGDGCLSLGPRGVFKLRIACCDAYPDIMRECESTIRAVAPHNAVGRVAGAGCTEVYSHSKHWICLFPQHGPGRKHNRVIELASWQQAIVDDHPRPFLRGLVHSDGCRVINRVKGHEYPRYHFSNRSYDIQALFGQACDRIGVEWRPNNDYCLSVARRASVAILDSFIGPKS